MTYVNKEYFLPTVPFPKCSSEEQNWRVVWLLVTSSHRGKGIIQEMEYSEFLGIEKVSGVRVQRWRENLGQKGRQSAKPCDVIKTGKDHGQ